MDPRSFSPTTAPYPSISARIGIRMTPTPRRRRAVSERSWNPTPPPVCVAPK